MDDNFGEYGWWILGILILLYFVHNRFILPFIQEIQQKKELEKRKKFDTETEETYRSRIQAARKRAQQALDSVVETHKHLKVKKQEYPQSIMKEISSEAGTDPHMFVTSLITSAPVVVFSKSYCPYCMNAKRALSTFRIRDDLYKIIELDERNDCDKIQDVLLELSGARSVPRVFIGGKCIGGGDDTVSALKDGRLKQMLEEAGAI